MSRLSLHLASRLNQRMQKLGQRGYQVIMRWRAPAGAARFRLTVAMIIA